MKKVHLILAAAASLVPLASLTAQDTEAPPPPAPLLVPADSTLFLHCKGPAAIAAIHAQDPIGAMFHHPVARESWNEITQDFLPYLKDWVKMLPENAPITKEQLLAMPKTLPAFDGSLTLGVYVRPTIDFANPTPEDFGAVFQFDPGMMDLAPIRTALQQWFDDMVDTPTPLEASGIKTAIGVLPFFEGLEMTRPFLYGKQLCICVGGDAEAVCTEAIATAKSNRTLAGKIRRNSFYVHLDGAHTTTALRTLLAKSSQEQRIAKTIEGFLGMTGITRAQFGTRSENGRSVDEYVVRWKEPPTGMFRTLLPKSGKPSTLQGYVPYHLQESTMARIAIKPMIQELFNVRSNVEEIDPNAPPMPIPSLPDMEEIFRQRIGLSLRTDFLDHLGEDYLKVEHIRLPDEDEEELESDDPRLQRFQIQQEDTCHVLSLRNGEAFAKSLERMVRKLTLHTARKRNTYKLQKVYTIRHPLLGGLVVHYAVHSRAVMIAFGKGGLHCLHAILDEIRDREAGKPQKLPKGIATSIEAQTPAPYAVSHINRAETRALAADIFEIQEEFGLEAWNEMVPLPLEDEKLNQLIAKSLRALFRWTAVATPKQPSHEKHTMRYENQTWILRAAW